MSLLSNLLGGGYISGYSGFSGYSGVQGISGYSGIDVSPIVATRVNNLLSSGLLTGGILTINADPQKFDLTAGTGFILDNYTDPSNPVYTPVSWATQTAMACPLIATADTTFLYIDSTGTIIHSADAPDEITRRNSIVLGWLDHPLRGPDIEFALTEPDPITDVQAQLADYLINIGSFNIYGNDFSANGTNLYIDRSEGHVFEMGSTWSTSKIDPSTYPSVASTATAFKYYHQDTPGVWHAPISATVIDPNQYDTGTGLAAVPTLKWTIQFIAYYAPKDQVDIQYGQRVYQTQAMAAQAVQEAITVNPYNSFDVARAWLVVQEGCTDLSDTATASFYSCGRTTIAEIESGKGAPVDQSLLYNIVGTGVQYGGTLTINGDNTKFDVAAGVGYVIDNTVPTNPDVTRVVWEPSTAVTLTYLATYPRSYILLNNAGTIVQQNYPVTSTQLRTHIYLGRISHTNYTTINNAVSEPALFRAQSAYLHDMYKAIGAISVSGNNITANGANLKFDRSAGSTFRLNVNFVTNADSPNITTDNAATPQSFRYEYQAAAAGVWTLVASGTDLDPNYYDNGSGTLQAVTAGLYTIQQVYLSAQASGTPNLFVFYGQRTYATKADAIVGLGDAVQVDPASDEYTHRASFILKGGTTDLSSADNQIVIGGKFGGGGAGAAGPTGLSGFSGFSGYSGFTGPDGISGYSGATGAGTSGFSGYSGVTGATGTSGYSGTVGTSGWSGYSGVGTSGYSGAVGTSGYSGAGGGSSTTTNGASAAGSTQGTATAITSTTTFVSTTAAGTGVILPNVTVGETRVIVNHGANSLNVYPSSGQTIDSLAANIPLPVPRGATLNITSKGSTGWEGVEVNTYDDENYCLIMPNAPTSPPTPNDGVGLLYSEAVAGRTSPEWKDQTGVDYMLQASKIDKIIGWIQPTAGVATPVVSGMTAPTIITTSTAVNPAVTNRFTRFPRTSSVSAGTAGLASGYYTAANGTPMTLGTGTAGGFFLTITFGPGDALSQAICFAGLTNVTTAPVATTSPATFTNIIGIGAATADTNMSLYYGGSAAQTPIALGAGFPKSTASTDMYRLTLYAPTNVSDTVYYKVSNLISGAASVSGQITAGTPGTQLPLNTAALYWRCFRANNATASATNTQLAQVYLELNF